MQIIAYRTLLRRPGADMALQRYICVQLASGLPLNGIGDPFSITPDSEVLNV